jgi:hypothetical protein
MGKLFPAKLCGKKWHMKDDARLSPQEIAEARQRRLEAMHLQEIEGNPLDAEDIAMFEMFEREAWPHERCLEYLREQTRKRSKAAAAE